CSRRTSPSPSRACRLSVKPGKPAPADRSNSRHQFTRRNFLATAAGALAAPLFLPSKALGRGGYVAPNEKIAIGSIGLGTRGSDHLRALLPCSAVQVVAVRDVFRTKADATQKKVDTHYGTPGCKAYQDFREMLARPDLDAVVIAAPENWHALISIAAMKAGAHAFSEVPLALTLREMWDIVDTSEATGRHCMMMENVN
ncbi:MAG: Gfo/Idh/MocA family oxidoreductase, partial [Kiritimatiellaeota bacterium]|nr:Gfo/Idh/MocA family oxidoreductase [Kiritimatiellota bacterium]